MLRDVSRLPWERCISEVDQNYTPSSNGLGAPSGLAAAAQSTLTADLISVIERLFYLGPRTVDQN